MVVCMQGGFPAAPDGYNDVKVLKMIIEHMF